MKTVRVSHPLFAPSLGRFNPDLDEHVPLVTRYFGQCHHGWVLTDQPGVEVCADCGATCERGRDGKLSSFDARLPVEPRRERRESRGSRG